MKGTVFLIFMMVVVSCRPAKESEPENKKTTLLQNQIALTASQAKNVKIEVGRPQLRSISNVIKANGMLDVPPQNLVSISAPLGGFVKSTQLLQGMKVKKGQELITLEHPDYIQLQQDYIDFKSQLEFLEQEYQRQTDLSKENVNALKSLQLAKSNFVSTRAKVQGLKAKLRLININPVDIENGEIKNYISIFSPIEGFVSQIHISLGQHVNPTDVMIRIVDTAHLHAEAQVFEKDIPSLKIGQRVLLRLSNESIDREAKVYLIGKEITPERTVRVHCHLEKEDATLIPRLFFSARIETSQVKVSTLPSDAIVLFENKSYVFVPTQPLHYEMVEVEKGVSEDGFTQVTLPEAMSGKQIVLTGAYFLLGILKNSEEE